MAAPSGALAFSGLYAFGDGLSDADNLYLADPNSYWFPGSPYLTGHFSNGTTWVEDLNTDLGFSPLLPSGFPGPTPATSFQPGGRDFAVGGAQSGPTLAGDGTYDLDLQVASFPGYLALHPDPKLSSALVALDIGANDIKQAFADNVDVDNALHHSGRQS